MRILVACEFSGAVRDQFALRGHFAVSYDWLPSTTPGYHLQEDVLTTLEDGWDMMIAFPPCTYLCRSGIHWNKNNPEREALTEQALEFVRKLMNAPIPKKVIENPIGLISTRIRKPDQIIQPYQFGEDASKATCLWLKEVPLLVPTQYIPPRIINGKQRWSNQHDNGQNILGETLARSKLRSETYLGIASAMGEQWGEWLWANEESTHPTNLKRKSLPKNSGVQYQIEN